MSKEYLNCTLSIFGCERPNCSGCGFDVDETKRRKKLRLTAGEDGLRQKVIRRRKVPNDEP